MTPSAVPTEAGSHTSTAAEVRTVAEIIAQFRRDQGLPAMPARRARLDDLDDLEDDDAPTAEILAGPWTIEATETVDSAEATDAPPTDAADAADTVDEHDDSDDSDDTGGPTPTGHDTGELAAVRARREAAWTAALRPSGTPPRRRRSASASSASSMIANLTAELATTHPGLLEGTPHSRRAVGGAARPAARRTAPAGNASTLKPVRVSAGLRGAALRVPALTSGWRVPTRTPLVLAGAVAVSVVVTDQAGLLSNATNDAAAANPTAQDGPLTASVQTRTADASAAAAADAAAASEGARQARARVSRLERSPAPADAAAKTATTTAAAGTAVSAAPPPDSVMKPGQTVPGDWVRPTAKGVYNSCFCSRWGTMHEGIDFAAPLGTPILAVGDGVVVQAGPASGFGNWVIIKHDNGDMTIYGHMRYFYVKIGQHVKAGQEIALVGQEGQSTGPHLHLGVKIGSTDGHDGTYVDPVPWLTARGIPVGTYNENG